MAKKKKLWYYITCHHKHVQLGSESTFIVRMVKTLDEAKELMQSIYDDAAKGRVGRMGKYSDPKWLDEDHYKVQITHDININGWLHSTTIETFDIHDDWNFNIFSDKSWILE